MGSIVYRPEKIRNVNSMHHKSHVLQKELMNHSSCIKLMNNVLLENANKVIITMFTSQKKIIFH